MFVSKLDNRMMTHTENVFTQYLFVSNKSGVQNIFCITYICHRLKEQMAIEFADVYRFNHTQPQQFKFDFYLAILTGVVLFVILQVSSLLAQVWALHKIARHEQTNF